MTALPTLKARVKTIFPTRVEGTNGVSVTKDNGIYTFGLAVDTLTDTPAIDSSTSDNYKIPVYDSLNDSYSAMSFDTLLGELTLDFPVSDAAFVLQDDGNNTKQMKFQLSGITAGNTRTLTVPDASTTLVGTDMTQTLTNKTLTSPSITGASITGSSTIHGLADGSAAAPVIAFTNGSGTTGIFRVTTGQIGFSSVGSQIARVTSGGFSVDAGNMVVVSGSYYLNGNQITATAGTGVITVPNVTDTLVGKATTDTLTNKTYDTAGTGNSFKINGVAVTANTGTGSVVRATSPTIATAALTSPTITGATISSNSTIALADGAAATPSVSFTSDPNTGIYSAGADQLGLSAGGTVIARVTTGGLSVDAGNAVVASGSYYLNGNQWTTTAGTGVITFPNTTTTLVGTNTTNTLTNKTYDTAGTGNSFSVNGVALTANTGTGAMVRASSPTITTPDITTGFTIGSAGTSGQFARGNGTRLVLSAIQVGDVPAVGTGTSGSTNNSSSGSGSFTAHTPTINIPANTFTTGRLLRVVALMRFNTGSAPPAFYHKLSLGATDVAQIGPFTPLANLTNMTMGVNFILAGLAAPGASANVESAFVGNFNGAASAASLNSITQPVALATNGALTLTFSTQWATAGTGTNTVQLMALSVEAIN